MENIENDGISDASGTAGNNGPLKFVIPIEVTVTNQNIDYILIGAFEGGINYWCREARVTQPPPDVKIVDDNNWISGDYDAATWDGWASSAVSRGGEVTLYDLESDDSWVLTREKMITGIKMFLANSRLSQGAIVDGKLDTGNFDANGDDVIVQYALFGEIVFG